MKSFFTLMAIFFVGSSAFAYDCKVSKISTNEVIPAEIAQVTDWAQIYSKPGAGHFSVGTYNGYRFIQVVKNTISKDGTVQTNDRSSDVGSWNSGTLSAQDSESDSKITCNFN